jgi:hypothetical protein
MNRIVTHGVAFIRRYEFPVDMESLLQRANSYRVDPTEAAREAAFRALPHGFQPDADVATDTPHPTQAERDAAFLKELGIRP